MTSLHSRCWEKSLLSLSLGFWEEAMMPLPVLLGLVPGSGEAEVDGDAVLVYWLLVSSSFSLLSCPSPFFWFFSLFFSSTSFYFCSSLCIALYHALIVFFFSRSVPHFHSSPLSSPFSVLSPPVFFLLPPGSSLFLFSFFHVLSSSVLHVFCPVLSSCFLFFSSLVPLQSPPPFLFFFSLVQLMLVHWLAVLLFVFFVLPVPPVFFSRFSFCPLPPLFSYSPLCLIFLLSVPPSVRLSSGFYSQKMHALR